VSGEEDANIFNSREMTRDAVDGDRPLLFIRLDTRVEASPFSFEGRAAREHLISIISAQERLELSERIYAFITQKLYGARRETREASHAILIARLTRTLRLKRTPLTLGL
jgi:hypothetical protein